MHWANYPGLTNSSGNCSGLRWSMWHKQNPEECFIKTEIETLEERYFPPSGVPKLGLPATMSILKSRRDLAAICKEEKMQVEMIMRAGERIPGSMEALILPRDPNSCSSSCSSRNYPIPALWPSKPPPLSVEANLYGLLSLQRVLNNKCSELCGTQRIKQKFSLLLLLLYLFVCLLKL